MMVWERLWMPRCLGSETLQGPENKWETPQKGMGGDLWAEQMSLLPWAGS